MSQTVDMRGLTRLAASLAAVVVLAEIVVVAAGLKAETLAGWSAYVSATERRRAGELNDPRRFLVMDHQDTAADERGAVLSGAIVVRPMSVVEGGRPMSVPSGLVHHWRGAVLVKGITVSELMSRIRRATPLSLQEDVLQSSVIARGPDFMKVYLRLQRSKIVTVVYNTEHDVRFARLDDRRAASTSTATKIAEVKHPGTEGERELPLGSDHGFLWGLNAYWRYEAAPGGTIAECESISLSRKIPAVLQYVAGPLIQDAARESMEKTLTALVRAGDPARTPPAPSQAR
jgi:hypothetical protein